MAQGHCQAPCIPVLSVSQKSITFPAWVWNPACGSCSPREQGRRESITHRTHTSLHFACGPSSPSVSETFASPALLFLFPPKHKAWLLDRKKKQEEVEEKRKRGREGLVEGGKEGRRVIPQCRKGIHYLLPVFSAQGQPKATSY